MSVNRACPFCTHHVFAHLHVTPMNMWWDSNRNRIEYRSSLNTKKKHIKRIGRKLWGGHIFFFFSQSPISISISFLCALHDILVCYKKAHEDQNTRIFSIYALCWGACTMAGWVGGTENGHDHPSPLVREGCGVRRYACLSFILLLVSCLFWRYCDNPVSEMRSEKER